MRKKVEFHCTNCYKYFDIKLNMKLNGNHRVHCPSCEHIHYRMIKDGEITGSRFNQNPDDPIVDDLRPMLASCRDHQEETRKENLPDLKGFMARLWKDRFSARV